MNKNNINNLDNTKKSKFNYDSLEMTKNINLIDINLIYDIDYLYYKKKLIKFIINDIELIYNFFNEEIRDILINIYILKKNNKILEDQFKIFQPIYDLLYLLNKLNYIDQDDFLLIIINLFKIKMISERINVFFENFIFKELINYNLLIKSIINLYDEISKKNILYITINKIINTQNKEIIIYELKNLAKNLCIDFFMYYNSQNFFNKIINNILITDEIINNKEYLNLINIFKVYKDLFINEYELHRIKYLEVYSIDEFELKIKFKLKKKNIDNLVENLNIIRNI